MERCCHAVIDIIDRVDDVHGQEKGVMMVPLRVRACTTFASVGTFGSNEYVEVGGCWCVELILVCFMGWYLNHLNKKQEARRISLGIPAHIKDTSLMSTKEAGEYKIELDINAKRLV